MALFTYYVVIESLNEPNYMETKRLREFVSLMFRIEKHLYSVLSPLIVVQFLPKIFATYDQIMISNIYHFGGYFNHNMQDIYWNAFLGYDVLKSFEMKFFQAFFWQFGITFLKSRDDNDLLTGEYWVLYFAATGRSSKGH